MLGVDKGKEIGIEFESIFRDAEVFCNGIYLGHERSGYNVQYYNLTDVLDYGAENVITVRCDASLEEGWFYEGAGIYRDVWMTKTAPVHVAHDGTYVRTAPMPGSNDFSRRAMLVIDATVENSQSATTPPPPTGTIIQPRLI